jgi:hypothetical protein
MEAIILAGGLGSRLRATVPDLPKPMAPIHGRPFLEYLLDYWAGQGVSRFVLSVGYKRDIIEEHFAARYKGTEVDYAVEEATSEKAKAPRGLFEREGRLAEQTPAEMAKPSGYDSVATVVRKGDVAMPVEVVLRFAGGKTYRSAWDGEARWKRYRARRGPKLLEAAVDPNEKILLDADRTNNGRRTEPDPRAASRWTARSLFWVQNLLDFVTVAW